MPKIQHHEIVKRFVEDPTSPSGLSERFVRRISTTSTLSFPGEDPETPEVYERGDDGRFEVPDHVAQFFVGGSTGHSRPGWSLYTGEDDIMPASRETPDVAALVARLAELEAQIAKVTKGGAKAA